MSKSDALVTVLGCDSTSRSAATSSGSPTLLLSGPATSSQEERKVRSLKEALFPVLDMLALVIALFTIISGGIVISGSFGFCSVLIGLSQLFGVALMGQDVNGVFAVTVGAILLMIALVSWRISEPLGTQLDRVSRTVFGQRYSKAQVLQSLTRWFGGVKSFAFAAVDVIGAGSALVMLAIVMACSLYFFLCCVPLPGYAIPEGTLLSSLGFSAFFALTFLFSWRLWTPLQAFFNRRWDVLAAVDEKAQ